MRIDSSIMIGPNGELILPELLGRADFDGDVLVAFALDPKFSQYFLIYTDIVPSVNAKNLRLRFSDNAGVSFFSSAGNYAFGGVGQTTVGYFEGSTSAAQIRLNTPQVGANAGEGWSGLAFINPGGGPSGVFPSILYRGFHQDAANSPDGVHGNGVCVATRNRITNLQVDFNGANLATGRIALYGLQK